jgi:alpha-mannosidase
VTSEYRWQQNPVTVTTTIEVRAGERLVRVAHAFENRVRNHRVRSWIPLREPAVLSEAECAFAIVTRGLEAEGGPTELGVPTFPSRRFVRAGGVTVVHEGLLEYELVDIVEGAAHALALTVLRSTGMLSQGPMLTRPLPAGPMTAMEGPQMQGPVAVRYGICIGEVDPYAMVDDAFVPLQVARPGTAPVGTPSEGQALSVMGAEVSAVLRREAGGPLVVRVFNPTPEATQVRIEGRRGWLVDLRGRPVEPFEGSFPLEPWRIATAILAE